MNDVDLVDRFGKVVMNDHASVTIDGEKTFEKAVAFNKIQAGKIHQYREGTLSYKTK